MKKIVYSLLVLLSISFVACLNSTTESTINSDGSGTVVNVVDMSGLLDLMEQMGKDLSTEEGADKVVDSTVSMKDMIPGVEKDLGRDLTADERELYKNSTLHMKANLQEKVLRFTIKSKFSKLSQLALLPDLQQNALEKNPVKTADEDTSSDDAEMDKMMDKPAKAMRMATKDGLIEYSFDKEKYIVSEEDQKMFEGIDQLGSMMGDAEVKMVYNLPRPVKNVTAGGKYELSEDKKKVTITYNFLEVFKDPSIQAYKIEY